MTHEGENVFRRVSKIDMLKALPPPALNKTFIRLGIMTLLYAAAPRGVTVKQLVSWLYDGNLNGGPIDPTNSVVVVISRMMRDGYPIKRIRFGEYVFDSSAAALAPSALSPRGAARAVPTSACFLDGAVSSLNSGPVC